MAVSAAIVALFGCGSRAPTLPPLRLAPPEIPAVVADQRGPLAVLRFGEILPETLDEGVPVRVQSVEILMYVEEYPALTATLLSAALDEERRDRVQGAREAGRSARESLERQREAQEAAALAEAAAAAAAAGEEIAEVEPEAEPEEAESETTDEPEVVLSEDELALRRVPRQALEEWRTAELRPDAILRTARTLQPAVNMLWEVLEMPVAIVDPAAPPALPDPGTVFAEARRVERWIDYPTSMPFEEFLDDAEQIALIDYEDLAAYRVGRSFEYTVPIELPPDSIRKRYLFVVRGISERGREGAEGRLLSLAPSALPAAPTGIDVELRERGVLLRWEAPATDLSGSPIDPETVRFHVYRRIAGEGTAWLRLTPAPQRQSALIDSGVDWGTNYVYEVRPVFGPLIDESADLPLTTALSVPAVTLAAVTALETAAATAPTQAPNTIKEGAPATTSVVNAVDVFTPNLVTQLSATRVGERVTLRWRASSSADVAGYRVYRHVPPTPVLPIGVIGEDETLPVGPVMQEFRQSLDRLARFFRTATYGLEADRRNRRNPLVADGWELLTNVLITSPRYIDVSSDPSNDWVYLVEAVDRAANVSLPVVVTVPASEQP